MNWSVRWNNLHICSRRDSNSGGGDLWSKALPIIQRKRPVKTWKEMLSTKTITSKSMLPGRYIIFLSEYFFGNNWMDCQNHDTVGKVWRPRLCRFCISVFPCQWTAIVSNQIRLCLGGLVLFLNWSYLDLLLKQVQIPGCNGLLNTELPKEFYTHWHTHTHTHKHTHC